MKPDTDSIREMAELIQEGLGTCIGHYVSESGAIMGCEANTCPFGIEQAQCDEDLAMSVTEKWLGEHTETPAITADKFHPVDKPFHYAQGGIEAIDAIKAALTAEEFAGFCKGNVLKYVWRERHKNGLQDLKKAMFYLDKLIKVKEVENGRK